MKNAKELMLEYTAFSIRDPKKAAEMFAEDGAFEMPYLATFGFPSEFRGHDAIAGFFQSVLDLYPGFQFENIKVLIDTPDQAFAEFESTTVSSKTGRSVHQLFFTRLVAENGKIKLLREALNTFEVARATVQDSAGLF
jgi:ketosteroid isomerase-like protein